MNKIAIMGAHGSGKSTLIKKIHAQYGKISITVTDVARVCPKLVGSNSNIDAQQWIMEHQLALESIMERNQMPVLFDNCSLGHLAYFCFWGGDAKIFRQQVVESMRTFDRILLLPPNPSFLYYDGLRPTNIDFQKAIFRTQLQMLSEWNIDHIVYNPLEGLSLENFIAEMTETDTRHSKIIFCTVENKGSFLALANDASEIRPLIGWIGQNDTREDAAARAVLRETGYLVRGASDLENNVIRFELNEPIRFTSVENSAGHSEIWLPKDKFDDITNKIGS